MNISRLFTFSCTFLLVSSTWCQDIFAAKPARGSKDTNLQVYRHGKVQSIAGTQGYEPLSWSSDGRWLALGKKSGSNWNLALFDSSSPVSSVLELSGSYSLPSWSPDGKQFVVSKEGDGILVCGVAGSEPSLKTLSPSGKNPVWSPLRGQIAFLGPKSSTSVFIISEDGKNLKPAISDLGVSDLAWAPDGTTLSFSISKKSSMTWHIYDSTKKIQTNKSAYDGGIQKWSPDGKQVLLKKQKKWVVVEVNGDKEKILGSQYSSPEWLDSKTIFACDANTPSTIDLAHLTATKLTNLPQELQSVATTALFRGIVLEGSLSNPFSTAEPPGPNQIRLVGTVENVELLQDTATIRVWSVLTPDKMELNLSQPLQQDVLVVDGSRRQQSKSTIKLNISDLIPGSEVAIWVRGSRAGVPGALTIERAWIPELVEIDAMAVGGSIRAGNVEYDGVSMDVITVPLVFPVIGSVNWSDTFLASRGGGSRRHHGQDLMAPKLRPLVAAFDGVVRFNSSKSGHNTITLRGNDGWSAIYMHVNNDTPGTDDGKGGARFAYAPGLKSGDRVIRGQLVGFCGDSGNAESTGPHCHFELHDEATGAVINATPSLQLAEKIQQPLPIIPKFESPNADSPVRWDIVVTQVDQERRVIVGESISFWKNGNSPEACVKPQKVYIKISPETKICLRSDRSQTKSFEQVKVGQFISILGGNSQVPERMEANLIGIGLDFGH